MKKKMYLGLRVGYGPSLKSYSPNEPLTVKMNRLTRSPLEPIEEAKLAARQVADSFGTVPWVCISGGLDSEATASAFLKAGVKFKAVTMEFEKGLNHHEVKFAIEYCKQNGIPHELIEVPIVDFFESQKFLEYFHHFKAQSVEVCAQFYFLDQFSEPFVWSGEPMRIFQKDDRVILQAVSDFEQMIYRYAEDRKRICVPNFHFYNAELAWSFFMLSTATRNDFFANDHVEAYYLQKNQFYRQGGFQLMESSLRKTKSHGFEHLKMYFDAKFAGTDKDYNSVYRIPWMNIYPTTKQTIVDIAKNDAIARKLFAGG